MSLVKLQDVYRKLYKLNESLVFEFCVSNPEFSYICDNNEFWVNKLDYDYPSYPAPSHFLKEGDMYAAYMAFHNIFRIMKKNRCQVFDDIIFEWLKIPENHYYAQLSSDYAAGNGHLDFIKRLAHIEIFPSQLGANMAARYCRTEVLEWMNELDLELPDTCFRSILIKLG